MTTEKVNEKVVDVVTSCKTVAQLNVALNYIKFAKKANKIGNDTFYLMFGVITALKGVYAKGEAT